MKQPITESIATTKTSPLKSWLTLAFLSLIWGTSYILIKKGLTVYTPIQLGCIRLVISALAFVPYFLLKSKEVDWSKWKPLLVVGVCGSGLPVFLFPLAQTEMSSSIAGILNSLTPLSTLILGILIFGSKMIWSKLIGVLLGLLGAAMLIVFGKEVGVGPNPWLSLYIVLGTICYAISANTVSAYLRSTSSLMISAVSFIMVGIPAVFYLFSTNFVQVLQETPQAWQALGYITILALASTVLASIVFFQLVQWTGPVFSSMVSYLVPIVAVIWGVFDGEPITLLHFSGMALILFGVYLSKKS